MAVERISLSQVLALVVVSRITVTLVYFPAMSDPSLKQDVWLASLLGALWSIPFVWVLNRLWQRFPAQTLAGVAQAVLGKVLGKAVLLLYLLFLLLAFSLNLRLTGEFFVFAILPRTPVIAVITVMAVLSAWAAHAGLEVIGRAGQMVFPILIGSILIVFVLLLKDIDWKSLTPVFIQSGPVANFKQMFSVVARNIEFAWLGALVPFVDQRQGLFRWVALAHVLQGVTWIVMGISVTGLLGSVQTALYFPFFATARLVTVADFLERLDALVMGAWQLGMLLRGAMVLWALSVSTGQWLGLKEYRPLVFPLAAIAVTYSPVMAENFSELRGYLRPETFTPYMLTFIWIFPVLLLVTASLRGLRGVSPTKGEAG